MTKTILSTGCELGVVKHGPAWNWNHPLCIVPTTERNEKQIHFIFARQKKGRRSRVQKQQFAHLRSRIIIAYRETLCHSWWMIYDPSEFGQEKRFLFLIIYSPNFKKRVPSRNTFVPQHNRSLLIARIIKTLICIVRAPHALLGLWGRWESPQRKSGTRDTKVGVTTLLRATIIILQGYYYTVWWSIFLHQNAPSNGVLPFRKYAIILYNNCFLWELLLLLGFLELVLKIVRRFAYDRSAAPRVSQIKAVNMLLNRRSFSQADPFPTLINNCLPMYRFAVRGKASKSVGTTTK